MGRAGQGVYTQRVRAAAEKLVRSLAESRPDYLARIGRAVSSLRPPEYLGLPWEAYRIALRAEVFEVALDWFRRNGARKLPENPLGLFVTSVKNRFINRQRSLNSRRRRERPLPEAELPVKGGRSVEGNASAREELARALKWMRALPPNQWRALHLHAVVGLSLAETAKVLGVSVTAVQNRVENARLALRRRYEQAGLALPGVPMMKKKGPAARKTGPGAKGPRPLRRPRL